MGIHQHNIPLKNSKNVKEFSHTFVLQIEQSLQSKFLTHLRTHHHIENDKTCCTHCHDWLHHCICPSSHGENHDSCQCLLHHRSSHSTPPVGFFDPLSFACKANGRPSNATVRPKSSMATLSCLQSSGSWW